VNGVYADFAHTKKFANNASAAPILSESWYHASPNQPTGVDEVLRLEWSNTQDTTPLFLLHKFGTNPADIALKRVLVGAPDSAGTGYRQLFVVN
jgi:hypothetical protein